MIIVFLYSASKKEGKTIQEIKRIVIPVDTSDAAKIATEQGLYFAKLLDVDVSIISVNDANQFMVSPLLENKIKKEHETVLEEVKQLAKKKGVNAKTELKVGSPSDEILKFTEEDDLIVMASHKRGGFNKFLLGSVSEEVIRNSNCSVMIIKPRYTNKKKD